MIRKAESGYSIGVVNPLTLVGKEVRDLLRARGVPYRSIELIDTKGEAEGTLTESDEAVAVVRAASEEVFAGLDVVFFCGHPEANRLWTDRLEDDVVVIDLSQPSAITEGAPAAIAGLNLDTIDESMSRIISPHPVAIPLAIIAHQLRQRYSPTLVAATVIQPASELGQEGIDELYQQTVSVLNIESPSKEIFGTQLAFNAFPAVDAAEIERLAVAQIREVVGSDLAVSLSIAQGTMFHGHTFSIFVTLDRQATEDEIVELLRGTDAIDVRDASDHTGPIEAGGRDEILVGRVSPDPSLENAFWIWAVADNVRRSSALNAVLVLEHLIARYGQNVQ